jgi:hypothetical protein
MRRALRIGASETSKLDGDFAAGPIRRYNHRQDSRVLLPWCRFRRSWRLTRPTGLAYIEVSCAVFARPLTLLPGSPRGRSRARTTKQPHSTRLSRC